MSYHSDAFPIADIVMGILFCFNQAYTYLLQHGKVHQLRTYYLKTRLYWYTELLNLSYYLSLNMSHSVSE